MPAITQLPTASTTTHHRGRRVPRIRSYSVEVVDAPEGSYSPGHQYVRRFWAAAIGKGAVRDLLDLFLAGLRGRRVHEPFYLGVLVSAGLAEVAGPRILIPSRVPLLPSPMLTRLGLDLRYDHRRWVR